MEFSLELEACLTSYVEKDKECKIFRTLALQCVSIQAAHYK